MDGRHGMFTHAFSETSSKPFRKNGFPRTDTVNPLHKSPQTDSCWRSQTMMLDKYQPKLDFMLHAQDLDQFLTICIE